MSKRIIWNKQRSASDLSGPNNLACLRYIWQYRSHCGSVDGHHMSVWFLRNMISILRPLLFELTISRSLIRVLITLECINKFDPQSRAIFIICINDKRTVGWPSAPVRDCPFFRRPTTAVSKLTGNSTQWEMTKYTFCCWNIFKVGHEKKLLIGLMNVQINDDLFFMFHFALAAFLCFCLSIRNGMVRWIN